MYIRGEGIIPVDESYEKIYEISQTFGLITNNKKIQYYNIPAAFDIEVSSFYQNGILEPDAKRAVMYVWQFGIGNLVLYGRTWEEFVIFLKALRAMLGISNDRRLIVYVHNLAYEFQFIRKRFSWTEVFMLDERKPVYALTDGIEFRCSLKLAGGKSLENVGKDLVKYPVEKKVGDLDYDIIRTPKTPLTQAELGYCENDIRVLLHYIQEKIENDGDITRIPLTNTGYVRNYCRKECYRRWKPYRKIMDELTLDSDEFSQLLRGFQGGYTHANAKYVKQVVHNVSSYDFTSSYPAVMLLEKFPMSKASLVTTKLNDEEFEHLLRTKCCLFDLELHDVVPKLHQAHPISRSKCTIAENYVLDNGRIVMAEKIKITCTEQDFFTYREFYDWGDFAVSNFRYYEKAYLPSRFSEAILGLYQMKTRLKGVEGEEINYMISKNMMNSAYGMCVTNPVRTELVYTGNTEDGCEKKPPDVEEAIAKYNEQKRRFLFYPWGVWVTAYARANLFSGILECGNDFVYSDTDSVKILNGKAHEDYFRRYDEGVMQKIERAAKANRKSPEDYSPKNIKGASKPIGVWDFEGVYDDFKTLGAKRYLVRSGDHYVLTLAGANKRKALAHLISTGVPFDSFDDGLRIPPDSSGRLTLTYIDDETQGTVIDCNGVPFSYTELSSVHMEKSEYNLTMSDDFINYLKGVIQIE